VVKVARSVATTLAALVMGILATRAVAIGQSPTDTNDLAANKALPLLSAARLPRRRPRRPCRRRAAWPPRQL
jgi:hypothetical protein